MEAKVASYEQPASAETAPPSVQLPTNDDEAPALPVSNPGFVERLVTQIIKNVQLFIKNIHIRLEDKITNPEKPFAAGFSLGRCAALSGPLFFPFGQFLFLSLFLTLALLLKRHFVDRVF